jgi:hypothetical protein
MKPDLVNPDFVNERAKMFVLFFDNSVFVIGKKKINVAKFESHKKMNPDFVNERANASFSSKELEFWLDGGKEKTEQKHRFQRIIDDDKTFDWKDVIHLDRSNVYRRGLEVSFVFLFLH